MAFGQPHQHDHMIAGLKAAVASPRTPEWLRPHLNARLKGGKVMKNAPLTGLPTNRAPLAGRGPKNAGMATGNNSANTGKRVGSMPPKAQGPPNPMLENDQVTSVQKIRTGGVFGNKSSGVHMRGQKMARKPKPMRNPMFYGG